MGVACGTYGREEGCIQDFVWETRGKGARGRHRRRLHDNIKMDL
jgi:hypothetical protein